jgi:hypothetical protein
MMSTLSRLMNSFLLTCILTICIWCVLRVTPRRILNAATRYAHEIHGSRSRAQRPEPGDAPTNSARALKSPWD